MNDKRNPGLKQSINDIKIVYDDMTKDSKLMQLLCNELDINIDEIDEDDERYIIYCDDFKTLKKEYYYSNKYKDWIDEMNQQTLPTWKE